MRRALSLIALVTSFLAVTGGAGAKENSQGPTVIKYADGKVVRKGADGSIETYNPDGSLKSVSGTEGSSESAGSDKTAAANPPVAASSGKKSSAAPATVKNLPNRHAGTRKINGVTVKVNTDGTVETYEPPESMGTIYGTGSHSRKPVTHSHRAPAHK